MLQKIISYTFFSCILIFGLTFLSFGVESKYNKKVNIDVNNIAYKFRKDVTDNGFISREMYDDLIKKLSLTGYNYDIKMTITRPEYYPLQPDNPKYSANKPWIQLNYTEGNRNIFSVIYDKDNPNIYKLRKNDQFSITISLANRFTSSNAIASYLGLYDDKNIYAHYDGSV